MLMTINGAEVLAMRLTLPLTGVWTLSADVSSGDAITGALTLEQDTLTYSGTVLRSGVSTGVCRLEAVGGAGGLGAGVAARSYQGVAARQVLADLLADASERLDSASTRAVLGETLSYWTRAGGRASAAMQTLADALGTRWRVKASGAVWVGDETWPKVGSDYDATELDRDYAAGNVLLAPESLALVPGVMLGDDKVGRVEHVVSRDSPLRTTYWLEGV
jgi:hypothetical protein